MKRGLAITVLAMLAIGVTTASAQQVEPIVHTLENGMRVLLMPRPGDPNVAAGWIARVGSVNERPGITGVAHLFEHMMFKGTHTIGTRDIEADLATIAELDRMRAEIRELEEELIERERRGEIPDAADPAARSQEHDTLIRRFDELIEEQRSLLIKDDFDRIYTGQGASGMNAGTTQDFTVYFVNVPANKLELWFWMESDRLANPVFREFYSERDVVHEERRLRTDSTPTGRFDEQFNSIFWQSSPYGWPVIGWPSDLEGLTREEALEFFDVYYAPDNITAALVGDFGAARAVELAELYFGRLERGPYAAPAPRTRETEQMAEARMVAYAETNPQVRVRYHTVADGHGDEPALVVMGQILSGRTGRLFRSLVEGQEVATQASAGQRGLRYEGYFEISGVAQADHTPEEVEEALYVELDRLAEEPVAARELQKVKNRNAAAEFRRLQGNFPLMIQLLIAEAYGSWERINTDPRMLQEVTAADIQRVASTYFDAENRTVGVYYRKDGSGESQDPRLAGLDDDERQQVRQVQSMLGRLPAEQITAMLEQLMQAADQAPEENRDMIEVLLELLQERLAEIEGGDDGEQR